MSNLLSHENFESAESLPRSYQDDILEGIFKIHLNRPVNELSNQFCRYYFATHLETEQEYFAIVFERSFHVPIRDLALLKKSRTPFLNSVIAYSLVRLSSSRKYQVAAICPAYNPENSLQKYIESHGPMSSNMVETKLLPALIKLIEFCNAHKLRCGNINPNNIMMDHEGRFFLREFITGLPNFYQNIPYLSPELSDLLPNARISYSLSGDIYAVGMTTYYALTGIVPSFSTHDTKLINAVRIESGTYNLISVKGKIPVQFRAMLAWTLQDNVSTRWNAASLSEWFLSPDRKSKYKILPSASNSSGHTMLFEGHNYSNPTAIASAMYALYEKGMRLCYNENFVKWSQKTKGRVDHHIDEMLKSKMSMGVFSNIIDSEKEEMFMKVLHMLDGLPYIRLRNFCITLESMPELLFSAIQGGNQTLFDNISKTLRRNYWKMVLPSDVLSAYPQEYIDNLTNLASMFSANSSEFSGKQAMYSLDPYIPCMSSTVVNDYVLTLSDLLLSLDKVAAHTPNKLSIDDHIVSFIMSRLGSDVITGSKINVNAVQFEDSIVVRGIGLLAIAQEHTNDVKIPHLSSLLAQKLIEWANDNLHSTKLRKVVTSEIAELAGNGDLASMLYVVSNPKLFHNDNRGYKAAYRQAVEIMNDMKYLSDGKRMNQIGIVLGQRLTVLFSYLLCMIVALILMM